MVRLISYSLSLTLKLHISFLLIFGTLLGSHVRLDVIELDFLVKVHQTLSKMSPKWGFSTILKKCYVNFCYKPSWLKINIVMFFFFSVYTPYLRKLFFRIYQFIIFRFSDISMNGITWSHWFCACWQETRKQEYLFKCSTDTKVNWKEKSFFAFLKIFLVIIVSNCMSNKLLVDKLWVTKLCTNNIGWILQV